MKRPAVHFLVGTGRCGSSILHEMICRHTDVVFVNNVEDRLGGGFRIANYRSELGELYRRLPPRFTTKGRVRFAPSEAYGVLRRTVSPELVEPYRDLLAADLTPALGSRVEKFFQYESDNPDSCLIHKFTGWPRARFLAEVFPDARFVHVVRDPRDVISSWLTMSWWRGHLGPDRWHFGPLDAKSHQHFVDSGESFVVLAALGWKILQVAANECRSALGERWIDVRYEDICNDPSDNLATIMGQFGIQVDPAWLSDVAKNVTGWQPKDVWPEIGEELPLVEAICEESMKRFDYSPSTPARAK